MKKNLLTILFTGLSALTFGQFTTGIVNLTSARTIRIDTNTTNVIMTLTGPSNAWFGIGFGGFSMAESSDMFIWNASTNRDYMAPGGHSTPSADAANAQSWTIVSDNVVGSVRTVIASRALVSNGDFTFTNNNTPINIIYAQGSSTTLGNHGANPHDVTTLQRTTLGAEKFSLNDAAVFPNPSNGNFIVKTKTGLDKIEVYTQTGAFVKTIDVKAATDTEVNVEGLSTGVYLIQLQNSTEKSWKKVLIN